MNDSSKLTFTLEDKPEAHASSKSQATFDWESGLEKLRQNRQTSRDEASLSGLKINNVALVREPVQVARPSENAASRRELDNKVRNKVLQEFLQEWQQTHNAQVPEQESVEVDTTVLLQEDWLSAQTALRVEEDESAIQRTQTVWLNPKRKPAVEAGEMQPSGEGETEEAEAFEAERIPVTVQVIEPRVNPNKPVLCLSESELMERLTKRLRPHITDAVAGMVRVAVQKQTATLTYQLQQALAEQVPDVVEEVLDYNIKAVLSEIKYDLKFKRNQ